VRNRPPSAGTFASPSGTPGERILKGAGITLVGVVLLKGMRFFLVPLYTRYLTPEDYGLLGVIVPLMGLLNMIARMGQGGALTFFMFEERDRPDCFRVTLSTIFLDVMFFSILVAVLFLFLGNRLFLFLLPETSSLFGTFRWLIVAFLLVVPSQQIVMAILNAREARIRIVVINTIMFLVTFGLALYHLVLQNTGAKGQILASVQANLVFFIPFLVVLFAVLGWQFRYSTQAARRTLIYGIPLLPHALSLWVLNLSDRLIVSKYCGLGEVGFYTFAYTCGMAMQFIVTSMQQVWGPVFFDTKKNIADSADILGVLATRWSVLLGGIAALGIVFTPEIIRIIASERYWIAIPYVVPVIVGYFFLGLYTFPGLMLQQARKTGILSLCTSAAAIANIVANFVLVPRYGAIAAAWNTAATFGLMAVLYYVVGMRFNPINIRWRGISVSVALVTGAVFVAACPVSGPLLALKGIGALILVGGFLLYVGGPRGAVVWLT